MMDGCMDGRRKALSEMEWEGGEGEGCEAEGRDRRKEL
jgi:hypothetical protein